MSCRVSGCAHDNLGHSVAAACETPSSFLPILCCKVHVLLISLCCTCVLAQYKAFRVCRRRARRNRATNRTRLTCGSAT